LPDLGPVPIFQARDQYGNALSTADLSSNDWIFCFLNPDHTAPTVTESLAEVDRNLARANRVLLVTMLTQPSLSPELLSTYATRNEASDRWRFISASPAVLNKAEAAWQELVDRTESIDSTIPWFALVDRNGHLRQVYDLNSREAVQRLLTDLGSLLRSEKK
jgi:cytochrome oxidase Cu insertion factor (SCO1/SenC/PrrC family)